jgi:hypothetical protein
MYTAYICLFFFYVIMDVVENYSSASLYLLTYLLTYSMEQSPSWEANPFVGSQEIPRVLLNPKVHYRIHKSPPPVSILSQPNPVHTLTSHFLQLNFASLI